MPRDEGNVRCPQVGLGIAIVDHPGHPKSQACPQSRNAAEALLRLAHKGGGGLHTRGTDAGFAALGLCAGGMDMQHARPNRARRHTTTFEISIDNEKKAVMSAGGDAFITPAAVPEDAKAHRNTGKPAPCAPRLLMHVLTERNTERNARNMADDTAPELDEMASISWPRSIMRKKTKEPPQRCGRLSFRESSPDEEELGDYCDVMQDAQGAKADQGGLSLVQRLEISSTRRTSPSSGARERAPDALVRTAALTLARAQRSAPPLPSNVDGALAFDQISANDRLSGTGINAAGGVKPPPYILSLQDQVRQMPISPQQLLNPAGLMNLQDASACSEQSNSERAKGTGIEGSQADAKPVTQGTREANQEDNCSHAQLVREFLGLPSNYVHKHDSNASRRVSDFASLQMEQSVNCGHSSRGFIVMEAQRISYLSNTVQGTVVRKSELARLQIFPQSYGRHDRNFDSILVSDLQGPVARDAENAHLNSSGNAKERAHKGGGADSLTVLLLGTTQCDRSSAQVHAELWCDDKCKAGSRCKGSLMHLDAPSI